VEKMAFVVAADRRLVELSIAQRFGGSNMAATMASQYLEKIIQIPISVPALGLGDTEAYLGMMLVERHLPDEEERLAKIISHCDERRQAAQPKVFLGLNELLPEQAKDDLYLASYLAPVLYERLDGNPRRLKRFLNAFWVRSAIAERRGAALEPTALAKLMVLELLAPDAFVQLLQWLGAGTLSEKLRHLEEKQTLPKDAHEAFEWWRSLTPDLADAELGPYLRLAASLRSRTGPRTDLRADLREVLDALHTGTVANKKKARERLKDLPEPDRTVLTREIAELMRVEPDTQADLALAVGELLKDEAQVEQLLEGMRRLDPTRVDSAVVIALQGGPTDKTHPVLREWRDSGRLDEVQANAVEAALEEGEG
jgi:hypothetical protein